MPQESSQRFGLRTSKEGAIQRSHDFAEWERLYVRGGEGGEVPVLTHKDFTVCTLRVYAIGYLQKSIGEVLVRTKPTEYRWREKTKMARKEKAKTRGSPKCKSMGFGNRFASNTNLGSATIQTASTCINVLFLALMEQHAVPNIQQRNMLQFLTDIYSATTIVSQSQIQT